MVPISEAIQKCETSERCNWYWEAIIVRRIANTTYHKLVKGKRMLNPRNTDNRFMTRMADNGAPGAA